MLHGIVYYEGREREGRRGRNGRSGIHSIKHVAHPSLPHLLPLFLSFILWQLIKYEIMPDLEVAMDLLLKTFYKYSGQDGDKNTLNKAELKDMLKNELPSLLGKSPDQKEVDNFFKNLDGDSSGTVDFTEFVTMVTCLTVICNELLQPCSKPKPKPKAK
ncbi:hypothetical protein AAFF_G00214790 [Aldrovandia affinis]|uniref:EF-hand domain-containing protein n=1 Tax=Aldrovandia affinis TaxID=143900 RepID=A0AAD7RGT1_9TELE|nr:hypothetical protein AAFF_G00214790 [Aldrovandia affinis]